MMPDNTIRDLRLAATVLRQVEHWDDAVLGELKAIAARLERMAQAMLDRELPAPLQAVPAPTGGEQGGT